MKFLALTLAAIYALGFLERPTRRWIPPLRRGLAVLGLVLVLLQVVACLGWVILPICLA